MKIPQNDNYSSLFIKYLFSYIIILIIPTIFISIFVNKTILSTLQDELIRTNLNTLSKIMYVSESNIKELKTIQTHIALNKNINTVNNLGDVKSAKNIIDEIKKYTISNNFIDNMGIYFHGDNFLYTSTSTHNISTFIDRDYKYSTWSRESFLDDISKVDKMTIRSTEKVLLYGLNEKNILTLMYPLSIYPYNTKATILFFIDENYFKGILPYNDGGISNYIIVDQNNKIISSNNTSLDKEFDLTSIDTLGKNSCTIKINNENLLVCETKSEQTGWKYISIIPISNAYKKITEVQIKFISVVIILMFIGSIFIFLSMKTNYQPLHMLKLYSDQVANIKDKDAIKSIHSTIQYLSDQNIKLKTNTLIHNKNNTLSQLLKGRIDSITDLKKLGLDFGMSFEKPFLCVLIFMFKFSESSDLQQNNISNINTYINEYINGYVKEHQDKDKLIFIANISLYEKACFTDTLQTIQSHLKTIFDTDITIGWGSISDETKIIPKSYMEATMAIDYRFIKGSGSIINGSELALNNINMAYPYQQFDKLRYLLQQGNTDSIEKVLSEIINSIKSSDLPLFYIKGICYNLVNIIATVINQLNDELLINRNEFSYGIILAEFETVDELINAVKNICLNICAYIRNSDIEKDDNLFSQIKKYIDCNYNDNNFSIQNMSNSFDMTLSNISQYFKNKCGITIMDYITNLKMNKAKQLLLETNFPLSKITEMIGYTNTSSFIRRFKQCNGITPGQFVKSNKK